MGGMRDIGGAMGNGQDMAAEVAKRHQMIKGRMEMMEMLMQRLPNPPSAK